MKIAAIVLLAALPTASYADDPVILCKIDHHTDDFQDGGPAKYDDIVIDVSRSDVEVRGISVRDDDHTYCYGNDRATEITDRELKWSCIGDNVLGGVTKRTGRINRFDGAVDFLTIIQNSDETVSRRLEYFGSCNFVTPKF